MNSFRTDLAMEAREAHGEISGVKMEQTKASGALVTRVTVLNEDGAKALSKPVGTYITVEHKDLCSASSRYGDNLARLIAQQMRSLFPQGKEVRTTLVAGLGNRALTPDSLGPRVVDKVLVTRHILTDTPDLVDRRVRSVCAAATGVKGTTGMETGETLKALVDAVKPDLVILIDSLAARSTQRILSTVQLTDAGVAPGSGVGNHRCALTAEALGVPVIALGVPTVVHASTILRDAMERITGQEVQIKNLLEDMQCDTLVVTPADIDETVRGAAQLVADALNLALQPELSQEELDRMRI